ncbi:MAG: deoxyribonuclease IV [Chthoniobacterales bacterium]|nr:deoxyribonuclease IV [Chthoniobacterales bacterium]
MPSKKSSDSLPLLGSHVPTIGGVATAIDRGVGIGCTAMQIFVKNNMQWFAKPLPEADARAFTDHPLRGRVEAVVAHAGYLINLGVEGTENHEKSLRSLADEMLRCEQLGIRSLVLHPGSHLGAGIEAGVACVIRNLDRLHADHPDLKVRITLETTAGQGACLGARFEEIAAILAGVKDRERLEVCLDTAHVFAAGYDLSAPGGAETTFAEFDRVIGMKHLSLLHINDSKAALGSRVDRHDNLGKGLIGLDTFRWIMRAKGLAAIPKILETPKGKDLAEDVEAMALLRSFLE